MSVTRSRLQCSGYSVPSLVITYDFVSAIQKAYHPNPGQVYAGTRQIAYLPDNPDGLRLLGRLKDAFRHGLTFDVSLGAITWGSIPHKTDLTGGAQKNGYPDPSYIPRCHAALDALRVNPAV